MPKNIIIAQKDIIMSIPEKNNKYHACIIMLCILQSCLNQSNINYIFLKMPYLLHTILYNTF